MMILADGPDMQTSLPDALQYLALGAVLVITFYVLKWMARRKVRGHVSGVVFRSPWAPVVTVHDGDVWFDGGEHWVWEHDRWVAATFEQIVAIDQRIAA
ncbi:hypothetical protein [Terracoccus sp. 273MFTsu3.1]|uniref:hypothetical protein n=1 Tax=Terracoccus sp. 273MFTsu3.1 TaxID=1172188 RepID=UPI000377F387|nr:hypothetical protein [Terracoccus sp. 273MFTsu3.1]